MIGNARDAETIRDYWVEREIIESEFSRYERGHFIGPVRPRLRMPYGWELLGTGTFRVAFLRHGVVYKVEKRYGGYGQSNRDESANIVLLHRLTKTLPNVSLPRTTFYELDGRGVMAMEYVGGRHPGWCDGYHSDDIRFCPSPFSGKCIKDFLADIRRVYGLWDMHEENLKYLPDQNRFVLIDLGA